jgi:hypothetical protein
MAGFISWMNEQRRDFYDICPEAFTDAGTIIDHRNWDNYLAIVALNSEAA